MTRTDRGRRVGVVAACALAASGFAPMMEVALDGGGVYAPPFAWWFRLFFMAVAIVAAVSAFQRAFVVAASFGAFALANGFWLLVTTYRGLESAQASAWARPGWGFIPLLAAGAVLASLPFWARVARVN
jgi:hypothetical protein